MNTAFLKPTAIRFLLLTVMAITFHLGAAAQSTPYKAALDALFNGFKTKDYALIKPLLDPNAKVGNLPRGMNDAVIPQIMKQLPAPVSYKITGTTKEGDDTRVQTLYTYASGEPRQQSFLFNAASKITDFDVLGDVATATVSSQSATGLLKRFDVPFELHQNEIFVKAMLNGKEEYFILDSGAPVLVLNSDHTSVGAVMPSGPQAMGIGGAIETGNTRLQSFRLQGLSLDSAAVISMSLKHLEKETGHPFAGLIGYTMLRDYELIFDYKRKMLTFVLTDAAGGLTCAVNLPASPLCTVPFEMVKHIPVFEMKIAGKAYRMGLDCGAGGNLLYAKYVPELKGHIAQLQKSSLSGAGTNVALTGKAGVIKSATIGMVSYKNMLFAFDDDNLTQLNSGYGLNIDGLLGYEFLRQHITAVNFRKGELTIYP